MQIDALRSDTAALFRVLDLMPEIEEFTLIGGTAMALHHAHRESEDLDFVYTPSDPSADRSRLPLELINKIIGQLREQGRRTESILDQAALDQAENEGSYLPSAQQDWSVNGAKLTFFAGDTADRVKPFHALPTVASKRIKLLTSDAIFETKGRLIVTRNTTRDLFDLWYFMQHEGKTVADVIGLELQERPYYSEELAKRRLLPNKASLADPGFKPLVSDAPRDFDALRVALEAKVNEYEQTVAEQVLIEEQGAPTPR